MKITLVVPCYNEELNLQKGVLDKIGNYVEKKIDIIEVLIVDDGSTDSSRESIKKNYLPKFNKFRLIENNHQGKAYAIITGVKEAKGDYVIFTDFDLATPIEEADKLVYEAKKGKQIIIGSRSKDRSGAPILRKLMAIGFIFIRDLMIDLSGVRDTQCGFKMFEKKAAIKIIENLQVYRNESTIKGSSVSAGFDLEFLFLAVKMGYEICEVPVVWRHVETKNVNFIKDSLETLQDIFRIKMFDIKGYYKSL